MKIKLETIFAFMILAVVYISVMEFNITSDIHHEIAIETITEFESAEVQQVPDDFLLHYETFITATSIMIPSNESSFILFNFEKDIFRPPLFT